MKRRRFTEEQIIKMLRSHKGGVPLADLARWHGYAEGHTSPILLAKKDLDGAERCYGVAAGFGSCADG